MYLVPFYFKCRDSERRYFVLLDLHGQTEVFYCDFSQETVVFDAEN